MSFLVAWGSLLVMGFGALLQYGYSPGAAAVVPKDWPAGTDVPLHRSKLTLLLFAHPRCPCTRASLGELSRLMSHCEGRLHAEVVFLRPEGAPDWEATGLVRTARAIPGVDVQFDAGGRQAALFGAITSGQALLYDYSGQLLFSGGITGSRGHAGDNPGSSAILSLVNHTTTTAASTPVFGCSLIPESGAPGSMDGSTLCSE